MDSVFANALQILISVFTMTIVHCVVRRSAALLVPVCLSLLTLAGCQSAGKQYVSPQESEPAATVVGTSPFFLVTIEKDGCYWGRTHISADKAVRLQPGVLTRVSQEGHLAAPYPIHQFQCRTFVDFTPRQGEHYLVKSEGTPSYRDSEGEFKYGSCKTAVWRQLPSGELERMPEEPRPVPMRVGFSCLTQKIGN